jgi:hypothetical protein
MRKQSFILIAVMGAMLASGCGKSSSSNGVPGGAYVPTPVPLPPPIPNGNPPPSNPGGSTVDFVPVSKATMEEYVASHPLNNPSNFKLTVNLKNAGNLRYAGEVRLSYQDATCPGGTCTGIFKAGEGVNSTYDGMFDNGTMKSEYNYWFVFNGKTVFNGFYQDPYGAVVLVVDNSVNQGDAQGTSTLSGSLYFRNFSTQFSTQSPERHCWFIYNGPYDCRSYTVINKTNTVPSDGYKLLGTFSGLVTSQAFGQ